MESTKITDSKKASNKGRRQSMMLWRGPIGGSFAAGAKRVSLDGTDMESVDNSGFASIFAIKEEEHEDQAGAVRGGEMIQISKDELDGLRRNSDALRVELNGMRKSMNAITQYSGEQLLAKRSYEQQLLNSGIQPVLGEGLARLSGASSISDDVTFINFSSPPMDKTTSRLNVSAAVDSIITRFEGREKTALLKRFFGRFNDFHMNERRLERAFYATIRKRIRSVLLVWRKQSMEDNTRYAKAVITRNKTYIKEYRRVVQKNKKLIICFFEFSDNKMRKILARWDLVAKKEKKLGEGYVKFANKNLRVRLLGWVSYTKKRLDVKRSHTAAGTAYRKSMMKANIWAWNRCTKKERVLKHLYKAIVKFDRQRFVKFFGAYFSAVIEQKRLRSIFNVIEKKRIQKFFYRIAVYVRYTEVARFGLTRWNGKVFMKYIYITKRAVSIVKRITQRQFLHKWKLFKAKNILLREFYHKLKKHFRLWALKKFFHGLKQIIALKDALYAQTFNMKKYAFSDWLTEHAEQKELSKLAAIITSGDRAEQHVPRLLGTAPVYTPHSHPRPTPAYQHSGSALVGSIVSERNVSGRVAGILRHGETPPPAQMPGRVLSFEDRNTATYSGSRDWPLETSSCAASSDSILEMARCIMADDWVNLNRIFGSLRTLDPDDTNIDLCDYISHFMEIVCSSKGSAFGQKPTHATWSISNSDVAFLAKHTITIRHGELARKDSFGPALLALLSSKKAHEIPLWHFDGSCESPLVSQSMELGGAFLRQPPFQCSQNMLGGNAETSAHVTQRDQHSTVMEQTERRFNAIRMSPHALGNLNPVVQGMLGTETHCAQLQYPPTQSRQNYAPHLGIVYGMEEHAPPSVASGHQDLDTSLGEVIAYDEYGRPKYACDYE